MASITTSYVPVSTASAPRVSLEERCWSAASLCLKTAALTATVASCIFIVTIPPLGLGLAIGSVVLLYAAAACQQRAQKVHLAHFPIDQAMVATALKTHKTANNVLFRWEVAEILTSSATLVVPTVVVATGVAFPPLLPILGALCFAVSMTTSHYRNVVQYNQNILQSQ